MTAAVLLGGLLVASWVLAVLERRAWARERARLVAAVLAPSPAAAHAALVVPEVRHGSSNGEPAHYPPAVGEY